MCGSSWALPPGGFYLFLKSSAGTCPTCIATGGVYTCRLLQLGCLQSRFHCNQADMHCLVGGNEAGASLAVAKEVLVW